MLRFFSSFPCRLARLLGVDTDGGTRLVSLYAGRSVQGCLPSFAGGAEVYVENWGASRTQGHGMAIKVGGR